MAKKKENRGAKRLTDEQVFTIMQDLAFGFKPSKLARINGVSCETICRIRDGKTYSNITRS